MRSHRVVLLLPLLDDLPCLSHAPEPVQIQALVAKLAVQALHVPVLHRLTRIDEVQRHPVLIGPRIQRLPRELRPVVERDPFRRPGPRTQLLQHPHHPLSGQRRV